MTIRDPTPLRVGLVGAGMISAHHLIAWSRVPEAKVVAIVDPDLSRAAARAAEFGIPRHYASLDELLDREKAIDAVDIASPRETHARLVRLAAERGIDVLCQKPLAPTFGEADALVRDVEGRIRLMVHENWRFRPYYRQIAQ
jgi:predicted dehydrogenase